MSGVMNVGSYECQELRMSGVTNVRSYEFQEL